MDAASKELPPHVAAAYARAARSLPLASAAPAARGLLVFYCLDERPTPEVARLVAMPGIEEWFTLSQRPPAHFVRSVGVDALHDLRDHFAHVHVALCWCCTQRVVTLPVLRQLEACLRRDAAVYPLISFSGNFGHPAHLSRSRLLQPAAVMEASWLVRCAARVDDWWRQRSGAALVGTALAAAVVGVGLGAVACATLQPAGLWPIAAGWGRPRPSA
jgi:hypothetical protein